MSIVVTKDLIIEDVKRVNTEYKKQFKASDSVVTRDYYREHGSFKEKEVNKIFGNFKNAVIESLENNIKYIRDSFDIKKECYEINKRYFVSSIVAGMKVNESFMQSIFTYCREQDAELILLVMRGVKKDDTFDDSIIEKYGKYIYTEIEFNSNIKAMDFLLAPQQIISLTGLSRLTKKGSSLIVAHTKLQMESVASRIGSFYHLMYSTGTVSLPNYSADRIGRIAKQDHENAGLIVEIVDDKIFHIRDIQADSKNGFCDLGKYYLKDSVSSMDSEIVLGDSHIGIEDKDAHIASKEMIKHLNCKKVYFQDAFDNRSTNPHEEHDMYAKNDRLPHQRSIEAELTYVGKFLEDFTSDLGKREYIIVPSNHNEFLDRYLKTGKFVFDSVDNAKIACELFPKYLDGYNPIEYFLTSRKFNIVKLSFPKREDPLDSYGWDILHGDIGSGGAKGSIRTFDICYDKNISGHSHSAGIFRKSRKVGTNSKEIQLYNKNGGSSWTMTNTVTYKNGTAQNINIINGKWKLD